MQLWPHWPNLVLAGITCHIMVIWHGYSHPKVTIAHAIHMHRYALISQLMASMRLCNGYIFVYMCVCVCVCNLYIKY